MIAGVNRLAEVTGAGNTSSKSLGLNHCEALVLKESSRLGGRDGQGQKGRISVHGLLDVAFSEACSS